VNAAKAELTGQRFGKLTVLRQADSRPKILSKKQNSACCQAEHFAVL
jgi:hypothetical protein